MVKFPCSTGILPAFTNFMLFCDTAWNVFRSLRVLKPKYLCISMFVSVRYVCLFGLDYDLEVILVMYLQLTYGEWRILLHLVKTSGF